MTAQSHQLLRKAQRALLREASEGTFRDPEQCAALAGAAAVVDALRRLTVYLEEPADAREFADAMLLTAVELWQIAGGSRRGAGGRITICDRTGRSTFASPAAASAAARGLAS